MIKYLRDLAKRGIQPFSGTPDQCYLRKLFEEIERLAIEAEPEFIGVVETWLSPSIDDALVEIDYGIRSYRGFR